MERTYIMIKPDGVQRGLVGEIISRFEKKGFKLAAMKLATPPREHLEVQFLLTYICNFHVLNHFLLIYICKFHWT